MTEDYNDHPILADYKRHFTPDGEATPHMLLERFALLPPKERAQGLQDIAKTVEGAFGGKRKQAALWNDYRKFTDLHRRMLRVGR